MIDAELRAAYEAGESMYSLSLDEGCSVPTIRKRLVEVGAQIKPKGGASQKGTRKGQNGSGPQAVRGQGEAIKVIRTNYRNHRRRGR